VFTGIVRDVGRLIEVMDLSHAQDKASSSIWMKSQSSSVGQRLAVVTKLPQDLFELGCSVACNGVCLTVIQILDVPSTGETILEFDVGPETLQRSTFRDAAKGLAINIEPALRVGDSLGGHELTGHVDSMAQVVSLSRTLDSDFWRLVIAAEKSFLQWCVPQGSVAIEGTSLTIAKIEESTEKLQLEIMLVPHTMENTRFKDLAAGSMVNIEFDSKVKAIVQTVRSILPQLLKVNP
jgi:riboflavin synthase